MSVTTAFGTGLGSLIFNNAALANVGDASGLQPSAADGDFYISLHTSSPGVGGNQTTNESAYTNYARVAMSRDGTDWTVTGLNIANAIAITFATCGVTGSTVTHFGIGSASSGAGNLFMFGALTASKAIANGDTPSFAIGELDTDIS
jgi:hypothetical protein